LHTIFGLTLKEVAAEIGLTVLAAQPRLLRANCRADRAVAQPGEKEVSRRYGFRDPGRYHKSGHRGMKEIVETLVIALALVIAVPVPAGLARYADSAAGPTCFADRNLSLFPLFGFTIDTLCHRGPN
jgi:hypothetical protein